MTDGPGRFITFEGGEGAGKSTQIGLLADRLQARGYEVVRTREPGGSPGAEAIRHILLSGAAKEFGPRMEAVLFAAARLDHVTQVIRPALARGAVVLCDRFMDSTRVYQGAAGELDTAFITTLERLAIDGEMPNLTLVLDLPADEGLARVRARGAAGGNGATAGPDRFEQDELAVQRRRREAFLELAKREPDRVRIVDASGDINAIADAVEAAVLTVLPPLVADDPKAALSGRRQR